MGESTSKYNLRALHKRLRAYNRNYLVLVGVALLLFWFMGSALRKIEISKDTEVLVTLEAKVLRPDIFYLFYMPQNEKQHNDVRSRSIHVEGSERVQNITFSLPDSLQVKELRFDLGTLLTLKSVHINKIYLSYNKKHLVLFDPSSGVNLINTNEFVTLRENTEFALHEAAGKTFDPFIYTSNILKGYGALLESKNTLPFPFVIAFIVVLALLIYALVFLKSMGSMPVFYSFASCFFVLLLLFPFFGQSFDLNNNATAEKRILAAKPKFNVSEMVDFAKKFESYFSDHFAFRDQLVNLGSKIRYHLFRSSSVPKAAVGQHGWLFLNGEFYKITEDLLKTNLYTEEQLEKSAREWEERADTLHRLEIAYYMAVWPDKHYIYPEYLPYCMRILNKDTLSRCDQAMQYLKRRNSPLKIVDVRAPLLEAKKDRLIYEKYDSHWNSYGAFIGYSELMREIEKKFPALRPHNLSSFDVHAEEQAGGDLSQMLGLGLTEVKPVFVLKNDSSLIEMPSTEGLPERSIIFENKRAHTNLTILIYRDSFSSALISFLKPHFKKMVLIWDVPFSIDHVNKIKPDLVLECYATRYFR
ncbi:MAG: hypothetical protein PSX36_09980 [bacterium]|nr:hypothetical protein [bacterium]